MAPPGAGPEATRRGLDQARAWLPSRCSSAAFWLPSGYPGKGDHVGRRRTQQTSNGLQPAGHDEEVAGTLFEGNDTIDHIYVERIDPAEGFLGRIPWPCPSLEEEIRGRYGGGKFKLR